MPDSDKRHASTTSIRIHHLAIQHFRGLREFSWYPAAGVNMLLGGGDVGKTTILEAIALLLSPTNSSILADSDYYGRNVEAGFLIEAIVALPANGAINYQVRPSWPWEWDGERAVVPTIDADAPSVGEPVYRFRVRGSPDLDVTHEIYQPDGTTENFPVGLRRSIGLVRLSGEERNDRDLRLVHGSALDRLLSDRSLRSRLASQLATTQVVKELSTEGQEALIELDKAFQLQTLPHSLDLAVTGSPGASIASMIGLTAAAQGVQLPLSSWGAGTRRLSALAIAEQRQGDAPVTLVDEIERGLEPYRQRLLMERLQASASQGFVTTHSPAAIASASKAHLWYIDQTGNVGPLDTSKLGRNLRGDPEAFLSRLTIVCEGLTEIGFARELLERALGAPLVEFGIHVTNGDGHEATLEVLEALTASGLRFGGFVDNEGKYPSRWKKLIAAQGDLLFRWQSGCLEENIIAAVPDEMMEALVADLSGEKDGARRRTLADRLDTDSKNFGSLRAKAAGPRALRQLIIDTSLGRVPPAKITQAKEYKSHAQTWFKTVKGGRELATKLFSFGLWPTLRSQLLPFCNAVRASAHLPAIQDL